MNFIYEHNHIPRCS